ncbi:N-acetylglucosamine-6-phosphate deacetylase [Mycoplasmopsis lipofaciens]|uniref:N-acetylglucosamine-6-phosphate deacetylase n=1 Tax=Mycoplasmopsis lipofaciens TaxID=114884 RepID=UPI000484B13A|nr:N-acetylglucosamine-6-phosphate deacetylase [Mycoplasmopsis lipofaciens]
MLIKNVKIVNFNETINNADLIIEDNKIKNIIKKDGYGKKILMPGLIDTHIHGFMNDDVMDSKEAVERISINLAKNGITSFMPTAMTNSWEKILKSLNHISKANYKGAKYIGTHIEGPYIGIEKKGAHKPEWLKTATKENIDELLKASEYKLKKISFDPKMLNNELIKYLVTKNVIPSIGHSAATYKQAQDAYDAGATCTCHLWNAMSGVDSRNPGLAEASLENKNVYAEMIIDFQHICPETINFSIKHKGIDKIMCISDAIKPAYIEDGPSISGGIKINKKGLLITLDGTNTIAGSGICIYDSVKFLRQLNYSFNDIVKLTSYNSAKNCNLNNTALIKEGYDADFIILDENTLDLEEVYINGIKIK